MLLQFFAMTTFLIYNIGALYDDVMQRRPIATKGGFCNRTIMILPFKNGSVRTTERRGTYGARSHWPFDAFPIAFGVLRTN